MTVSRDIDKFWQELNNRPTKTDKQTLVKLSDAGSTQLKPLSSKVSPQVDHSDHSLSLTVPASKEAGSTVCRDLNVENLEQHIQRPLQMLKDPAAAVRSRGLHRLKVHNS